MLCARGAGFVGKLFQHRPQRPRPRDRRELLRNPTRYLLLSH